MMKTVEFVSDVAAIAIIAGGTAFNIQNESHSDGSYQAHIMDDDERPYPDGPWEFIQFLTVTKPNSTFISWSDCPDFDKDGNLTPLHSLVHEFEVGKYEVHVKGGDFLFNRAG